MARRGVVVRKRSCVCESLDSDRYESLRAKLARNKFAASLFNTRQFTKSFEDSLQEAVRRNARGEEPANLRIPS